MFFNLGYVVKTIFVYYIHNNLFHHRSYRLHHRHSLYRNLENQDYRSSQCGL